MEYDKNKPLYSVKIHHQEVNVFYNLKIELQIEYALDFRDILKLNEVPYIENPPISKVIESLEKPIKKTKSLIERLKKN